MVAVLGILLLGLAPVAGEAPNLARDGAKVSVDSTFRGYHATVLTDGRWVAPGEESEADRSSAERFGNAGNTWVSGEAKGVEHWVRLDWPRAVRLDHVAIWWSRPEWQPRAFRVEWLSDQAWVPLTDDQAWLVPTERRTAITFAPREVRSIRLLQHANGHGERGLLALQEILADDRAGAAPTVEGARPVSDEELRRMNPLDLPRNLARLHVDQPGADQAVAWTAAGEAELVAALNDGDAATAAEPPHNAVAFGIRWPVTHVADGAMVAFVGDAPAADGWRLEALAGGEWLPVTLDLSWQRREHRLECSFEPCAADALRWRPPADLPAVAEVEVGRCLMRPEQWPARLVEGNRFEHELLAAGREPSFAELASAALSMQPARALLGLKDAEDEIGVGWDGTVVTRQGTLHFAFGPDGRRLDEARDTVRRELLDGWRPGTVVTGRLGDLAVRQTAFVSFATNGEADAALFVRVELRNLGGTSCHTGVTVACEAKGAPPAVEEDGCLARGDALVLCSSRPARAGAAPSTLEVDVDLAPGAVANVDFVQPFDTLVAAEVYRAARFEAALVAFMQYWDRLLAPAVRIEVPEERVNRAWRAIVAQLFINAEGDVMPYGSFPSAYDSHLYGVEEAYAMMGLALYGYPADAQRYLDATYLTPEFLRKVDAYQAYPNRHQQYRNGLQPADVVAAFRLSRDEAWARSHLGLLRECAEWTMAQRRTTMVEENGERPLHWGLLPKWSYGGDISELQCYALYANFACWRGLVDTAWLMAQLGDQEAAQRYASEAADYRQCLDRAVDGNVQRDRQPPFLPVQLYATQPVGNDYDQLFDGILLNLWPFDLKGSRVAWLTDWLEQDNRLFCGLPRFRRDVGPGGLDGLYGLGYLLTKLHQDQVDRFLLGFYAYLAFNLERDTFASRETNLIYATDVHQRASYKVPDMSDPVPCSAAVFLHLLRHLLVTETLSGPGVEDGGIDLLTAAPRAWFADGRTIRVDNAPTDYGLLSFVVTSHVAAGRIEATVTPPTRNAWREMRLRLRHPDGRRWRRVMVNGKAWHHVEPDGEWIVLEPGAVEHRVLAEY